MPSLTDLRVPFTTLEKLPAGAVLLGVYHAVEDVEGNFHTAIKCVWREAGQLRIAFFGFNTGQYLGDTY